MGRVPVLVADDHRAFADAIAIRLGAEIDIDVVGVATRALEAQRLVVALEPDVVVLDVEFPDGDGIQVAEWLRREGDAQIVIVTFHADAGTALAAVRAGVIGFVAKDASPEELVQAVRAAARGEAWIQPRLLAAVLQELARGPRPRTSEEQKLANLTQRERDVLECMSRGLDRAAIARELFLSMNTVRTHIQRVLAKLEVHSSLEAVSVALRARDGNGSRTHHG